MKVGVLAIQGAFRQHLEALARLDVDGLEVRRPADLAQVDALIIPGGESTSIGQGLADSQLLAPLRAFASEKPIWGVCAGLILLADKLEAKSAPWGGTQPLVGGLHVKVSRNHFGRQSQSRYRPLDLANRLQNVPGKFAGMSHFIRAPAITEVGPNVEVLARAAGVIVAVLQGNLLGTAFHPEVSYDDSWLRLFLVEVCRLPEDGAWTVHRTNPPSQELACAPWTLPPALPAGASTAMGNSVKLSFPVFQQGGVIMDVVNAEQARIAESAGAVSVMALERIPADIKADGGVARMSDPEMIQQVIDAVTIPVMAKARIGHFAEAQVLEALDVDCIDESEVLTAADEAHHIDKRRFQIPFVCGAKDLGEALRRIAEGAAMIRLKGNAGTGNVVQAVRHARAVFAEIRQLTTLREDEIFVFAKEHRVPVEVVERTRAAGRLPVITFAAGGLATPADVALLMQLGCDGVFVGSGIFKGENPEKRARAMVAACTHFRDAGAVARASKGLGKAMVGLLDNGETYALTSNQDSKL